MNYMLRWIGLAVYGWFSTLWLRNVVSKPAPGIGRLTLSAPLLVGHITTALVFDTKTEVTATAAVILAFVWLGTFKVPSQPSQIQAVRPTSISQHELSFRSQK